MQTFISASEMRDTLKGLRFDGKTVALVPTMGALHEGHMSLIREAKNECNYLLASIFVNPTQFGPNEDFASYPRMLQEDADKLRGLGVDGLFVPNAKDMYPEGFQTFVVNNDMSSLLCGRHRPDHFRGVLTVVTKLLNLVQPDLAIFGKKDYQQLQIIKKMVRDLNVPTEIRGLDTVREADGLAMSSRNLKLDQDLRVEAPLLYQGLRSARHLFEEGERNSAKLIQTFKDTIRDSSFSLQYAEIRDQKSLHDFEGAIDKPAVLAVAAFLGDVRLIDNIELGQ